MSVPCGSCLVRRRDRIATLRVLAITGGNERTFDGLTTYAVTEVKNVKYQYLSSQLKDTLAYAHDNTLRFDLYVPINARLSEPLKEAIRSGQINLRWIP